MGGTNCAVPGCYYSVKNPHNFQRRSLFTVYRPEFTSNVEEREHRINLTNFLLSLRNDDAIYQMLHKESASICEFHFSPEDVSGQGRKALRVGSMPVVCHPKRSCKDLCRRLVCSIPGCNQEVLADIIKTNVPNIYKSFVVRSPRSVDSKDLKQILFKKLCRMMHQAESVKSPIGIQNRFRICERHFAESDITSIELDSGHVRKELRSGALPTLHLPRTLTRVMPERRTKKKRAREQIKIDPTIRHKTFASLVCSARKLSQLTQSWNIGVTEDSLSMLKHGDRTTTLPEIVIEITNDFTIGVVYYGWCLPEDHFARKYNLRKNSLSDFVTFMETLQPCEGVSLPSQYVLSEEDERISKHVVIESADPFSFTKARTACLANRSHECDLLLRKQSYNICKSCTRAGSVIRTKVNEMEKEAGKPFETIPAVEESDSPYCKRLKLTLEMKQKDFDVMSKLYKHSKNLYENYQKFTSELLKKKELTVDNYMKLIRDYAKKNNSPETFETFWKFQLEMLMKGTEEKIAKQGVRYSKEMLKIWSGVYSKGRFAYRQLRNLQVLVMPQCSTMKKFSEEFEQEKTEAMECIIKDVVQIMNDKENLMGSGKDCNDHVNLPNPLTPDSDSRTDSNHRETSLSWLSRQTKSPAIDLSSVIAVNIADGDDCPPAKRQKIVHTNENEYILVPTNMGVQMFEELVDAEAGDNSENGEPNRNHGCRDIVVEVGVPTMLHSECDFSDDGKDISTETSLSIYDLEWTNGQTDP